MYVRRFSVTSFILCVDGVKISVYTCVKVCVCVCVRERERERERERGVICKKERG